MTALPYVLLDDSLTPGGRGLLFTAPKEVISVSEPGDVEAAAKVAKSFKTRDPGARINIAWLTAKALKRSPEVAAAYVMIAVFGSRPISAICDTDLPEPDSPTMPRVFPRSTVKLTPSTARTVPSSVWK